MDVSVDSVVFSVERTDFAALLFQFYTPPSDVFAGVGQVALPTTTAACGAGKEVATCRLWLGGKTQRVQAHSATQPCVRS